MTSEQLAARLEVVVQDELAKYVNAKVHKFTPSIKMGRRYVGVTMQDGTTFSVTLEVEGE
jgi:hypothetical protein